MLIFKHEVEGAAAETKDSLIKGLTSYEQELQKMNIPSLERRLDFYRMMAKACERDPKPSKYTLYRWKAGMVDRELKLRRQGMINKLTGGRFFPHL